MQKVSTSFSAGGWRERSFFYMANPAVKFLIVFVLAMFGIFIQQLQTLVVISIIYSILFFVFANLRWKYILLLYFAVLLMSALSGVNLLLFGKGESVIWQFAWWKISHESIHFALVVIFRTLLMTTLGLLFSTVTNPTLFCYALMQQFKVSPNMAYGCLAAMRMLPLMVEEFQQLQKALKIRGSRQRNSIKKYWQWLMRTMLILLAQAIRRAYRTSLAVATKQFNPKLPRTYYYHTRVSKYDVYYFVVLVSCTILPMYYFGFK